MSGLPDSSTQRVTFEVGCATPFRIVRYTRLTTIQDRDSILTRDVWFLEKALTALAVPQVRPDIRESQPDALVQ